MGDKNLQGRVVSDETEWAVPEWRGITSSKGLESGYELLYTATRSHLVFHHTLDNTKPLTLYLVVYLYLSRRLHEGLRHLNFRKRMKIIEKRKI